jgi:hypothetical protein
MGFFSMINSNRKKESRQSACEVCQRANNARGGGGAVILYVTVCMDNGYSVSVSMDIYLIHVYSFNSSKDVHLDSKAVISMPKDALSNGELVLKLYPVPSANILNFHKKFQLLNINLKTFPVPNYLENISSNLKELTLEMKFCEPSFMFLFAIKEEL